MDLEFDNGSWASSQETENRQYLHVRTQLTQDLVDSPYDVILYLRRAVVYANLGYPDLAAGDAYRGLLLTDEILNPEFEYHEQALERIQSYTIDDIPEVLQHGNLGVVSLASIDPTNLPNVSEGHEQLALLASVRSYQILTISLLLCGCLDSAYKFCEKGLTVTANNAELLSMRQNIRQLAERRLHGRPFDATRLPEKGLARREIYPWNTAEPDRYDQDTLLFLNQRLQEMAPSCEIRITELPTLNDNTMVSTDDQSSYSSITKQLGIFATRDIAPGEQILLEYSLLSANNRHRESTCDACSAELPPLGQDSSAVSCTFCNDVAFCDDACHRSAQELYHPAVCDKDVESIAKDPDVADLDESLYLLLLARAMAMAAHQQVSPLEIEQVKYLWGDFIDTATNALDLSPNADPPPEWTLPFSFKYNIETPLHILEKMDIDIYRTLPQYDLWILNTCFAKFRGTASAKKNDRNGRPEIAAVHPYWCLANHSCDPNVTWNWTGRMRMWARDSRVLDTNQPGIRKGEEIFSHYCDISLPVDQRREWAKGALGGACMCERCRVESDNRHNGIDH